MNSEEPTYYYHGKTIDGYRFTIAGRYQALNDDPDKDVNVIMMGLSLCSRTENFVKKLGRMKAEGRMKSKSPKGRSFFSLYYKKELTRNWFVEEKTKHFIEAAALNSALKRDSLMRKFGL